MSRQKFPSPHSLKALSYTKNPEQRTLQVLLQSFKRAPTDGLFRCYLTTLENDTLFEIESNSETDSKTLDILQYVTNLSSAKRGSSMRSICLLSRLSDNVQDIFDHRFQLCCKILIKVCIFRAFFSFFDFYTSIETCYGSGLSRDQYCNPTLTRRWKG